MNKRQRELTNTLAELAAPVIAARPEGKPAGKPSGLSVRMASEDTVELLIYGRIGGGGWFDEGGITSLAVIEALREAGPVANVHVRINSGGGDVFEGVGIHTALRRHAGTVTTYVDGLAASAASFIAMAGDRVVVARGAMMMIHDGMTSTYGGPASHRRTLETLEKVSDVIADLYAARAGEDAAHWRALMSKNDEDGTWFTADEALELGLADEMTDADEDAPVTAAAGLKQWSAVLDRAPEAVRALVGRVEEQQRVADEQGDEHERHEQEHADEHAPVSGVDQSAPDQVHNADQSVTDEQDSEADIDFRFRMRMWQFQQQHRAAA